MLIAACTRPSDPLMNVLTSHVITIHQTDIQILGIEDGIVVGVSHAA